VRNETASAILISAGFFFSVLPPTATQASGAVSLIYAGALILAIGVVALGIGLLRSAQPSSMLLFALLWWSTRAADADEPKQWHRQDCCVR